MQTRSTLMSATEVLIVAVLAAAVAIASFSGCGPVPTPDVAEAAFALIKMQHDYGVGEVPADLWSESQALIAEYRGSTDQARRAAITLRLLAIKAEVCPLREEADDEDD